MSIHGGNIREASEILGLKEKEIIDFSSNINPLGIHKSIKNKIIANIDLIASYPDPHNKKLLKSLSDFYTIEQKNILPGNGSSELIYLLTYLLSPKKAMIIQPNFLEYQLALNNINCKILNIIGEDKNNFKIEIENILKKIKNINILFLSNPNNPSGYIYTKEELKELLKVCTRSKCFLFIDEAFLDFLPDYNNITMSNEIKKNKYLIILKTLTKFYSIPGLRLGLIAGNEELLKRLKNFQYPWAINCFSQLIGNDILQDKKYINNTIEYIVNEKKIILNELSGLKDLKIFPSHANYFLCKITGKKTITSLENKLTENKIIIRNCSNYTGLNNKYFRIAVKTEKNNKLMIKCLKNFFNK